MKLAWIIYDEDPDFPEVKIVFEEPESYKFNMYKVVPIVYAELKE